MSQNRMTGDDTWLAVHNDGSLDIHHGPEPEFSQDEGILQTSDIEQATIYLLIIDLCKRLDSLSMQSLEEAIADLNS